jgi:hypothetical protein
VSFIEKKIEQLVNRECEQAFNTFVFHIDSTMRCLILPDGLSEKMTAFCKEQKHIFYRGFREKLNARVEGVLVDALRPKVTMDVLRDEKGFPTDFVAQKNRIYLEAYLINGQNGRRAAESIGVAKSTYHDWLKDHEELVNSELNKTQAVGLQ